MPRKTSQVALLVRAGCSSLAQCVRRTCRTSNVERELAELKKVVAALAVRSVAHEEKAVDFDVEGITVLDADTAYQLLDNPPEPTEALRNLLALR